MPSTSATAPCRLRLGGNYGVCYGYNGYRGGRVVGVTSVSRRNCRPARARRRESGAYGGGYGYNNANADLGVQLPASIIAAAITDVDLYASRRHRTATTTAIIAATKPDWPSRSGGHVMRAGLRARAHSSIHRKRPSA